MSYKNSSNHMKKILQYTILCMIFSGCSTSIPNPPEEWGIYTKKRTYSSAYSALNWLKAKQNKDWTWGDTDSRDVLTPLVVLSFMSQGEPPTSIEYGDTVVRGIKAVLERIDNPKRELLEPAKTISMWCLAETYAMTKIPMLKNPLKKWSQKGDFDFSTPWTFWALKAYFCTDLGYDEEIDNKLKRCLDTLRKSPENLSNVSTVVNASLQFGERREEILLFKKFWDLSPEEWRKSNKPILTELNISMIFWYAISKKERKWKDIFWGKIWDSQIIKKDMGWWSEEKIGIDPETEYVFDNLSEDDKQIYITSMIIISIAPRRWLPTFKILKHTEDNQEDLDLKLE